MVTGEMVEELVLSGADIIKVGIGPGKNVTVCVERCGGGGCCVVRRRGGSYCLLLQGQCAQHARRQEWGIPN